ncbi:hypothetical protein TWF694_000074 [Orbilia ellipsospora]|uniref:Uncharacterized protein n=1 Tax=Orbilia ellipsospora TaxID=2528407 RepID=A0AAV9XP94_9PEZI
MVQYHTTSTRRSRYSVPQSLCALGFSLHPFLEWSIFKQASDLTSLEVIPSIRMVINQPVFRVAFKARRGRSLLMGVHITRNARSPGVGFLPMPGEGDVQGPRA